ncbi:MAG: class I SAM-dependent methyltransferase [Myxococcales bacterium]|nr:class I SAM-dependent methyltransferase [Myxococcales bacterium]
MSTSRSKRKHKAPAFTAKNSDKHVLYQLSVQDAKVEVEFILDAYKKRNKKLPTSLREDFCGTQLICAEWVKSHDKRTATGVDIDKTVLAWGKKHNLAPLGDAEKRVHQLQQDVRAPSRAKFDAICAFNFSYWIFTTRDEMRGYFEKVHKALAPGGVFCIDAYGGWEAVEPMYERRNIKNKFTYVWDQDEFDPITHRVVNHIHFEFKDGSKMNKAFTYVWRYWSLPELAELLSEAGFSNVATYWDRSEEDDEEDYRPTKRAENQPGWLAYMVASR